MLQPPHLSFYTNAELLQTIYCVNCCKIVNIIMRCMTGTCKWCKFIKWVFIRLFFFSGCLWTRKAPLAQGITRIEPILIPNRQDSVWCVLSLDTRVNSYWVITWLRCPAKIKGAKKDATIYVEMSMAVHNLLFCIHKLCISYVRKLLYWLVPRSVVSDYCVLCTVKAN